jgi:MYXO-CTERM domain-containing protein
VGARSEVPLLSNRSLVRRAFLVFLTLFLVAGSALAAGRIDWKSKTFKERSDKSWMLELAIYLPRAPDVAYVPMKFEFQPEVYYERSLLDGHDGPVDRKVPLENRQPLIESVDVGFMDSATTKIESRTRFSFKVKRDLGYEAGEYKVTVRDTRNGQVVGSPTTIIFDGENEIIDRRAMVFSGEKKKDKKPEEKKATADDDKKSDSGDSDKSAADDSSAKSDDDAPADNSGGDKPAPVEKNSSGCGCRLPASSHTAGLEWIGALALGLAFAARRRQR